jgi:hypothetical protein
MAEGIETGVDIVVLLPSFEVYDRTALTLMAARAVVGVVLFVAGWLIYGKTRLGWKLAPPALIVSAALRTVELGAAITPTNLFPTYRWPVIITYWCYAIGACWALAPGSRSAE